MRLLSQPCKEYSREIVIDGDLRRARKVREDETQYDILYFIECLGKARGRRYSVKVAPDDKYRNEPQPDRLIIDEQGNYCIALEHAELYESLEYPKKLNYEIQKHGWNSGPPPSPCELAARLSQAIEKKKKKRQFVNYPSLEKIILFRDRCTSGNTKSFFECARYLVLSDEPGCDHCHVLLSSGVVLEVF